MSKPGQSATDVKKRLQDMQEFERLSNDEQVRKYRDQDLTITRQSGVINDLRAKLKQSDLELLAVNKQFDHMLATTPPNALSAWTRAGDRRGKSGTAILALNDWHSEENVDPAVINGVNEFNLDICDARIRRTVEKFLMLLDMSRKATDIDRVIVWLGGDLITGYIHEELQETNWLSPIEACLWIESRVIELLKTIEKEAKVKHIRVVTNYGNHGRSTPKKRIKSGYKNSYEWGAYNHIARVFADNSKFSFNIAKGEIVYEDVEGHVIRFSHGDAVRYEGGVGGITIPILKRISQWDKTRRADVDVFGHWHQFLHHWKFVACGALIGYSDWTVHIGGDYQPPSQTFMLMDHKLGMVDVRPIFCEPKAKYQKTA